MNRRRYLLGSLAMLGVACGRETKGSTLELQPGAIEKLGVCARVQDTASRYGNPAQVRMMLDYLGLNTIRTGHIRYTGASSWRNFEAIARLGVQMVMTVRGGRQPAEIIADLDRFATRFPGILAGIEGPNEIDHNPVTYVRPDNTIVRDLKIDAKSNPVVALAFQADLYRRAKDTRSLRDLPVIAFSDFAQEAQMSDVNNTHPYPRQGSLLNTDKIVEGNTKQVWITETGAPSAPDPRFYREATPQSQADFVRDAVLKVSAEPMIEKMFLYQLMDNYQDPTPDGSGGMQYHFGLFDYDYQPKPAARALREMLLSEPASALSG